MMQSNTRTLGDVGLVRASQYDLAGEQAGGAKDAYHLVADKRGVILGVDPRHGGLQLIDCAGTRSMLENSHADAGAIVRGKSEGETKPEPAPSSNEVVPAYVLRARSNYPKAFTIWNESDDEKLRSLWNKGATVEEISQALGRGPGGVKARAAAVGLVAEGSNEITGGESGRRRVAPVGWSGEPPVCQMDWMPTWLTYEPELRYVEQTANCWGAPWDIFMRTLLSLEENMRQVFVLRYGLARRCSFTVDAVAEGLAISRSEVQRLQAAAEAAMRESLESAGFAIRYVTFAETLNRRHSMGGKRAHKMVPYA